MKQLEQDKIFLEHFLEKLEKIAQRKEKLEKYYNENYLEDMDKYPNENLWILSEDGLYNLFFEVETLEKNILKFLANKL